MRRGCRGSQDIPLPDWHAVAVHRARSSALPPRVCGCWSVRGRWSSQKLKKAPVPRILHAPMQTTRSADRIPQSNGRGWPVGRATHRVTACDHHAQGSRPCPWCRTTCRPGFRRSCGRCPQARYVTGLNSKRAYRLHRLTIAPPTDPLSSRISTQKSVFLHLFVLFMFSCRSRQGERLCDANVSGGLRLRCASDCDSDSDFGVCAGAGVSSLRP